MMLRETMEILIFAINWLFSWRAESRSCPNGFSIMTLRQRPFSSRNKPNSANRFAIVAK